MKNTNSVRMICATSIGVIVTLVRSHRLAGAPRGWQRAPPFPDVRLVLVTEIFERGEYRCRSRVAKGAERFAGDVRRDARQQIEIAHLAFAALDALEDLVEPVRAFAARRALAARLVTIEMQQVLGEPHHAGGVVEHDDRRRSEQRPGLLDGVEAGLRVELVRHQDRHGRAAGDDRLQFPAVAHAARAIFDQLAKRDVHRRFVDARPLDMSADAVELRAAVLFRAESREPLGAFGDDEGHVAEGLDVVDGRRLVIEADDGGKRRLVARLGALAFKRLEERGLFAGLIGTGPAVHEDIAVEPGAEDVPAEEPARVGLVDRSLENLLGVQEFTPYIDVGDFRADGVAADGAALDEQVRIPLDEQVILERARLALVGVAGDVARGDFLVDELPLHARREARAAASAEAGRLDHLDDLVRLLAQSDLERAVALVRQIEI